MSNLALAIETPDPWAAAANDNVPPRFAIFAQGYQSGSPLGGALGGAMGGLGMSETLAPLFGMAAGPFAPIAAGLGAVAGEAKQIEFKLEEEDE